MKRSVWVVTPVVWLAITRTALRKKRPITISKNANMGLSQTIPVNFYLFNVNIVITLPV
jgi:hypothetical protein